MSNPSSDDPLAPIEVDGYDLLKIVRLLERSVWAHDDAAAAPTDPTGVNPKLRFASTVSLGFPGGAIRRIRPIAEKDDRPRMLLETAFFGLTGAVGAMPMHLSSVLIESGDVDREPLRRLLELLDHRAVSLFVRGAERAMLLWRLERSALGDQGRLDPFSEALEGLVGQLGQSSRSNLSISRWATLYHAGHFGCVRRPPASLAAMLSEATGFEVAIVEHVGHWRSVPSDGRSAVGRPSSVNKESDPYNSRLGQSVCIGARVWTCQDLFRVRIGPVDYATFRRLQPGGDLHRQLSELVRLYVGPALNFEFQVLLPPDEVPRCRLSAGGDGVRLRWSTWLSTREFKAPVDDARFRGAQLDQFVR